MRAEYHDAMKLKHATRNIKEYVPVVKFFLGASDLVSTTIKCGARQRTRTNAIGYGKSIAHIIVVMGFDDMTPRAAVATAEQIYTELRLTGKSVEEYKASQEQRSLPE